LFETIFLVILVIFTIFLIGSGVLLAVYWSRFTRREKKSLYYTQLLIRPPKYNEVKIEVAETMFTSFHSLFRHGLHGVIKGQDHLGFEIVAEGGQIDFYI
jgi:hypothetical protein